MKWITSFLLSLIFLPVCQAVELTTEFSADAVQTAPMRPAFNARMYVSKEAVRTDSTLNGQPVIEIVYPKKSTHILIVPKERVKVIHHGIKLHNDLTCQDGLELIERKKRGIVLGAASRLSVQKGGLFLID